MKQNEFKQFEDGVTLIAITISHYSMVYLNGYPLNSTFEYIMCGLIEGFILLCVILGFITLRLNRVH